MFLEQAKKELAQIEYEIAQIDERMALFPDGRIAFKKNGKYVKWMISDRGEQKVIPKKNAELASQLAMKKHSGARKNDLQFYQLELSRFIRKIEEYNPRESKILQDENIIKLIKFAHVEQEGSYANAKIRNIGGQDDLSVDEDIAKLVSEWKNASYVKNEKHQDQLKLIGLSGVSLRSKSEVIIEQVLTLRNIPFRYECLLQLNDIDFYPDFTVMNPYTGAIVVWEHFGMVDNPQYLQSAMQKLSIYISNGYLPGVNMIVTFETLDKPLDARYINSIINAYFLK